MKKIFSKYNIKIIPKIYEPAIIMHQKEETQVSVSHKNNAKIPYNQTRCTTNIIRQINNKKNSKL